VLLDELRPCDQDQLIVGRHPDLVHANHARMPAQQGQLDEAVQQFKEALRLNPAYAQAYINLGRALVRLGRKDEAVQDFEEALRLKPNSDEAKQQLRELGMPVPPL